MNNRLTSVTAILILSTTVSVLGYAQPSANPVAQARLIVRQAGEAYRQKDYARARDLFSQAQQLRPDHPGIIYNIAACNALVGNAAEASKRLEEVAAMGLAYHPEQDSDFVSLWNTATFREVQKRFDTNNKPVGVVLPAFQLNQSELIAEGIAYHEAEQSFYVSSVRKRKIIRIGANGEQHDFSNPSDSLWAAMGMAVDQQRHLLWVATTAFPFMEGFRDDLNGRSAVVQYDLKSKQLVRRWEIPVDGKGHILGDLAVTKTGEVYATDGQTPAIYRITREGTIERYITSDEFVSLQGITFSGDGKKLYVSDYSRGIFVIDPVSKKAELMGQLSSQTLLSIDGLYYDSHSLIGIQNEITPNRIARFFLSEDGKTLTGVNILSMNNPSAEEPTLGVIVGKNFYFNGNSQWKNLTARGQVRPNAAWEPHRVMKLRLP